MTDGNGNRQPPHWRRAPILAVILFLAVFIVAGAGGETATAQGAAPPATNIRVADGANPGEVVITWDAVPEVTYYRFGYVNMVTDYPAAQANGNWLEAFIYVDIVNRGQTSYTLRRLEPGVRHAFSVLTNSSRYGEPTWPSNPTWVYLTTDGGEPGVQPPATPAASAGPTGLTAVPGPGVGQVSLTWTPVGEAALHLVWSVRPDGAEGQWHDAGAGSAVVSGLEAGLEYSFAVIAGYASSGGEVSHWSAFSNRVRATAKAAPPADTASPSSIAAGGKHTCMLQDDNTVVCWGANGDADKGQADPPAGTSFTAITAGYEHTCGITNSGAARCWGDNDSGESSAPTGVSFTAIDAGRAHTCALSMDGTAECWGSNEYGQLNAPTGAFTAITAGGEHSCGLRQDGRVECWGDNHYQQGAPPDALFFSISAGMWHTCGIKQDDSIACWGANPDGQAPAEVEGAYQAVSAGRRYSCGIPAAVELGRDVKCWGAEKFGLAEFENREFRDFHIISLDVGEFHFCIAHRKYNNETTAICSGNNGYGQAAPTFTSSGTFTAVSAGHALTCGIRTDGTRTCWGRAGLTWFCQIWDDDSQSCQLSFFHGYDQYSDWRQTIPSGGSFQSVSLSSYGYGCGVRKDGTIACWGNNANDQAFPPRGLFHSVDAGSISTCAVRTNGTIICWGGYRDERGNSRLNAPPKGSFQSVSVSQYDACGVRANGAVDCWGILGEQVEAPPRGSFQSVSVGDWHTCGVQTDGTVVCWWQFYDGSIRAGEAGEGAFKSVSAGRGYTCGVRTDGTVDCWGERNEYGQATPPEGLFQSVSAGATHACGLRVDGYVTCWGADQYGQAMPP